ncbi:hypothetical protein DPMN_030502 [Dreissena polymorpha]|uniref:Uncharacterized protein n=1 Tax=Dreissena polymorpha TaxID=45954 RepID=A0A9D4RG83_DREPO|nr:hypothetical protein DPMN_030502 [Dreissena polymorpha]
MICCLLQKGSEALCLSYRSYVCPTVPMFVLHAMCCPTGPMFVIHVKCPMYVIQVKCPLYVLQVICLSCRSMYVLQVICLSFRFCVFPTGPVYVLQVLCPMFYVCPTGPIYVLQVLCPVYVLQVLCRMFVLQVLCPIPMYSDSRPPHQQSIPQRHSKKVKCWNRILKAFANSLDPDETPQNVASHQDPNLQLTRHKHNPRLRHGQIISTRRPNRVFTRHIAVALGINPRNDAESVLTSRTFVE